MSRTGGLRGDCAGDGYAVQGHAFYAFLYSVGIPHCDPEGRAAPPTDDFELFPVGGDAGIYDQSFEAQADAQDPTHLDYGLCDRDVTSVFTGYVNYDLPFGHDRAFKSTNKALNAVAGDWMISSIVTFHGGFPISMLDYSADPTGAYFQPRPDCLSGSVATPFKNYEGGGYIWFDPTTMRDPASGKLGNCPISSERGPGLR